MNAIKKYETLETSGTESRVCDYLYRYIKLIMYNGFLEVFLYTHRFLIDGKKTIILLNHKYY